MVKRAIEREHQRIKKELERQGVSLSPEVVRAVLGNPDGDSS